MKYFWVLIFVACSLNASIAKRHKSPTLSYVQHNNPNQYRYGNVAQATILRFDKEIYSNILFRPMGTIFPESITFCGDQTDSFDLYTTNIVVLIFSRVMHHKDCYDLLEIDVMDQSHIAGR